MGEEINEPDAQLLKRLGEELDRIEQQKHKNAQKVQESHQHWIAQVQDGAIYSSKVKRKPTRWQKLWWWFFPFTLCEYWQLINDRYYLCRYKEDGSIATRYLDVHKQGFTTEFTRCAPLPFFIAWLLARQMAKRHPEYQHYLISVADAAFLNDITKEQI